MTPLFRLALIACAGASLSSIAAAEPALPAKANDKVWTQAQSDIQPDPAVRFGQLANGMRYAIVHNDTPAHETSLRLRIGSGSLEERDDQQGLAHFLEHMAFKGSTHVPRDEMIKLLERHGLAFGPDTNAQTGFTQTVFMLDLPESDPQTLDLGLMLMRETASELTLAQSAMDPERGVVLSEERVSDSPDYEAMKKHLEFQLPGQLAPHRLPIGKVDVLKTAPVSLIRDYYAANYRPDRATLIVVGDVDPAAMEAAIKAKFGDWKPVGPETAAPDLGRIGERGAQTQLIVQPGARSWIKPFDPAPDSEAKTRREEIEAIAVAVLNRRLEHAAQSDAPPFVSAGANVDDAFESAHETGLFMLPKPGAWKSALTAAVHIERQAVDYGVTQAEVDREVVELRTRLQTAADAAATRRTPAIAQELVRTVDENEVFTSPAQDLARFDNDVKGLTAAEISHALKTVFSGQGPLLSMVTPDPIEGGRDALAGAFAQAQGDKVATAAAQTLKAWPYKSFGAPGTVASRREVADLGITYVTFTNGVRLAIKPTAFRKDQVLVNVRFGDGLLGLPKDRKTVIWAHSALTLGGLGKISLEDMERVLADKQYGAQFAVTDDAFVLGGRTTPADLDTQLQVLAAYVSDPGFNPAAFERIRNAFAAQLPQLDSTPQGVLGRNLAALEHSGDARWAKLTEADVGAARLADLEAILKPRLASAPLEVDVVGDVKPDEVIRKVAATFAALPARAPSPSVPAIAYAIHFPATGAPPVDLTHKGRPDQAIAYEAWPTNGLFSDPQRARVLNIAAQVLELRMIDKVRVAEGTTYSPNAAGSPSDVFPTYGVVYADVETPPAKIDGLFTDVRDITADLRAKGPTQDEMDRAIRPRVEGFTKAQQTNEYWMTWVAGSDTDPRRLDIVRDTIPGYNRITAAQVQAAAAAYLTDANAWRLEVTAKGETK
jgi:zinc protease